MGFQFKMERINLFILRGMSLISKFVLLFVLAGKGNEQLVFTYGLLFSLVTYVTYFLSFDLYTYTTREFISTPLKNKYTVLYQHIMSSLLISLISLPLIGLLYIDFWLLQKCQTERSSIFFLEEADGLWYIV